tara:strand:+ start:276 stop:1277 length:1002 start_codon:yes stop_codon:yes gene_type:complete
MTSKMIKNVVCSIRRGSLEESQHQIHCVVINENHDILFQSGDINQDYCLRSTLKPFQSAASINLGTHTKYNFSDKEISITCASHHCEDQHINTIRSILKKINLSEQDLECGFHFPFDKKNKTKLHSQQINKSNIYNNCSGKHAGLLAMMQHLNIPTQNYINHTHPIHQHINDYIIDIAGKHPLEFAVDGCSLPTPYFSLYALAKMYIRLIAAPSPSPLSTVYRSMVQHPELVSGIKGFDSYFMKLFDGRAVCKGGAEGMQSLAIKTKNHGYISLALKVLDGNHRGNYISCVTILYYLNIINDEEYGSLLDFINVNQYNFNQIKTGQLVCNIVD